MFRFCVTNRRGESEGKAAGVTGRPGRRASGSAGVPAARPRPVLVAGFSTRPIEGQAQQHAEHGAFSGLNSSEFTNHELRISHAVVAQQGELPPCKRPVAGSTPADGSITDGAVAPALCASANADGGELFVARHAGHEQSQAHAGGARRDQLMTQLAVAVEGDGIAPPESHIHTGPSAHARTIAQTLTPRAARLAGLLRPAKVTQWSRAYAAMKAAGR